MKTSFLNNLSHEVRTPLNCIMGLSDMIAREEFTDEERQSFSEIINRSGRQLTQIINDIISQSSYESGQEVVYDVPFELANELELLKNRVYLDYIGASVTFEMQTNLPANPCISEATNTKFLRSSGNCSTTHLSSQPLVR